MSEFLGAQVSVVPYLEVPPRKPPFVEIDLSFMELICFYFLRWISHLQLTVFAPVQMVWLWHGNQAEKREGDAQIDRETWRVLQSWCSLEVRGILQSSGPEDSEAKAKASADMQET